MEKVISIGGQNVRLISSGATPLIYKNAFNHDFFKDFSQVIDLAVKANEAANDTEIAGEMVSYIPLFQRFIWTYAKNANQQLPELKDWLSTFDDFPTFDVVDDLIELMMASVSSKKN